MDQNPPSRCISQEQILVALPTRADGIGRALRSAFRGRLHKTPNDFARLLEKLT